MVPPHYVALVLGRLVLIIAPPALFAHVPGVPPELFVEGRCGLAFAEGCSRVELLMGAILDGR